MNNKSSSFSWSLSIVIEAFIVFAVLSIFLVLEFVYRNLLTQAVVLEIIKTTLVLSVSYILLYRISKSGYFVIHNLVSSVINKKEESKHSVYDYLIDSYFTLILILTTVPVRPILQKVRFEDGKPVFDQALVKFDATITMLILGVVAIPLVLAVIKKHQGTVRHLYIVGIFLLILIAGFINNKPNYDARIYESRADWITRNWEKQGIDAKKAIKDAKTDSEKAIAYYWLGVSENRKGNTSEAMSYQQKAIELDPEYGAPYSSLSLIYIQLGDLEKAKLNADKCVSLMPEYAWCYYALFGYYDRSGLKNEAYLNITKALNLDPNAVDIQYTFEDFKRKNPELL